MERGAGISHRTSRPKLQSVCQYFTTVIKKTCYEKSLFAGARLCSKEARSRRRRRGRPFTSTGKRGIADRSIEEMDRRRGRRGRIRADQYGARSDGEKATRATRKETRDAARVRRAREEGEDRGRWERGCKRRRRPWIALEGDYRVIDMVLLGRTARIRRRDRARACRG